MIMIILLLMITVAVAGIISFWLSSITKMTLESESTFYAVKYKTVYAVEYKIPSAKQVNAYCQSLGYSNGWLSLVCSKENQVNCHDSKGGWDRYECETWVN